MKRVRRISMTIYKCPYCTAPSLIKRRTGILLSIVSVLGTEMKHTNLNDRNTNFKITATKILSFTTIILVLVGTTVTTTTTTPLAYAWINPDIDPTTKAPAVISGENVYIVWWTDRGTVNANGEVMFRASTDGGATFTDKINLSNTTNADSVDAEISAEGTDVIVTWWERNQTSDIPVARVSNDAGETFGPLVLLAANGTLGSGEAEEIGVVGEGGEEEG
jgi:hypothetical protein